MTQSYAMVCMWGWGNATPLYAFEYAHRAGHARNSSAVDDSFIVETRDQIDVTLDQTERSKLWGDLSIYAMENAFYFREPAPYLFTFWQPWLKAYTGECMVARYTDQSTFWTFVWLDRDLKEAIAGRG